MHGAAVLVVKVVGVFPDVEGEERGEAAGDRIGGAGLLGDVEGAVGSGGKPDPTGAKSARPVAAKTDLNVSTVPHCFSIWSLRCPVRPGMTT